MAQVSINCRICGDRHKLNIKNFPLELWLPPTDKQGKVILGKPPEFAGYGCKKCDRKDRRDKFIKEHGIKAGGGRTLSDKIRDKIKELKFKSKIVKDIAPKKEKQNLFQQIKSRLTMGRQQKGGR